MLFKAENLRAFSHKIWGAVIPAAVWGILFALRGHTLRPWCAVTPTPCTPDQVNAFDRLAFQFTNGVQYDHWSTVIQDSMVGILFLFPFILYTRKFWAKAWSEAWLMLEISLWNGVGLEVARAFIQRPRPLVFRSPMEDGANIHQYTSFYSGHTSFVSLASLGMYFMICRRFPNQKWIQLNFLFLFLSLSFLEASLRILGGRHFPTDTIGGFVVGCSLCILLNARKKRTENF